MDDDTADRDFGHDNDMTAVLERSRALIFSDTSVSMSRLLELPGTVPVPVPVCIDSLEKWPSVEGTSTFLSGKETRRFD